MDAIRDRMKNLLETTPKPPSEWYHPRFKATPRRLRYGWRRLSSTLALISACTGVLLAPLALLSVLSGYCMRNPWLTGTLTLGALGEYNLCVEIHTLQTPELLTLIGLAHVVATAELLHSKYHRLNPTLRILLGVYRIAVWILVLITLIVVVVHVIT